MKMYTILIIFIFISTNIHSIHTLYANAKLSFDCQHGILVRTLRDREHSLKAALLSGYGTLDPGDPITLTASFLIYNEPV